MKNALQTALDKRGYTSLTPVQEAILNPEYEGADLLVSAQTGSGKTLAFGMTIAPTILGEEEVFGPAAAPLALVIAPTRELALQVKRELGWLYAEAGVFVASCVGGMDMRDERRALARGAHIVVATPGRLRDHIMRESIDLSQIRAVVLDEADEMLDLGFREDLEFILGEAPEDRQTLLFSATVPKSIAALAQSYQRDAIRVVAKSEATQHADIEYRAMLVADRDVDNAVINTLRYYEAPNAIVFANTRAMVNRLTTRLSNRGFNVVALSGELSQSERTHALQAMRDGRAQVCVATDVAARGIDLPKLDLVVHAELPSNHETLLHRSGRTGRAGRKGVSALVVTKKSRKKAERILGWAKLTAEWNNAPSADEVKARDEERMFADPVWAEPIAESDLETVTKLTEAFSAEQIAAAYLRLLHSIHTAPEELSEFEKKRPLHKDFGPSVWFSIEGGHDAGAEPRRVLPMLCKMGDITKDDIGAIRVQKDQTYVQILEASVDGFLASIGTEMKVEDGAALTRLAGEPKLAPQGGKPRFGGKPSGKFGPKPHRGKPRKDDGYKPRPPREDAKGGEGETRKSKPGKPPRKADPDVHRAAKPQGKPGKQGGHDTPRRAKSDAPSKTRKPKGPPPPVGKPNSKKNKARAAAAAKAKAAEKRKGGRK